MPTSGFVAPAWFAWRALLLLDALSAWSFRWVLAGMSRESSCPAGSTIALGPYMAGFAARTIVLAMLSFELRKPGFSANAPLRTGCLRPFWATRGVLVRRLRRHPAFQQAGTTWDLSSPPIEHARSRCSDRWVFETGTSVGQGVQVDFEVNYGSNDRWSVRTRIHELSTVVDTERSQLNPAPEKEARSDLSHSIPPQETTA